MYELKRPTASRPQWVIDASRFIGACLTGDGRQAPTGHFAGRAIAALAEDRDVLGIGSGDDHPELAREYGFTDVDGKQQSVFWDEHWAGTWGD